MVALYFKHKKNTFVNEGTNSVHNVLQHPRSKLLLSLYIFTSCAVFWRARWASENTNNE